MEEKDHKWYDEMYSLSQEYKKEPEDSMYYHIWKKAVSLIKRERIIDFGCGSGQFAKLLVKKGKRFVKGYDFSKEAIHMARKMNYNIQGQFSVRNLLKLGKLPAHDLVICFEVLEHIEEDLAVIKKVPKGKRFIFSVPNFEYRSHVRKFDNIDEIITRYSDLVDIKEIYPFDMGNDKIIYLVDSVRS